jgi:hypothetical protein
VGNPVGAAVGMPDGIWLGEGDGINDGLNVGIVVAGVAVGEGEGRFVGLHDVHESEKLIAFAEPSPMKTFHEVVVSGGVLLQPFTSPP